MMRDGGKVIDRCTASIERGAAVQASARPINWLYFECRRADGSLRWLAHGRNLVVNVGLDFTLDTLFAGSAYTASWFIGLTDASPTVAPTDTMAVHPGWVEITAYSEPNRPGLTVAAASGQSINNFASPAVFTANATATVGGAFTVTNNTKGGSTGTLYNAVAFVEGDKPLTASDTLTVRCSYSQSAT